MLNLIRLQATQTKLLKRIEKKETHFKKRMTSSYKNTAYDIRKDILAFYAMYATDKDFIRYRDVVLPLSTSDRNLLREQCKTFLLEDSEHSSLIPDLDRIHRLNRLQGLQLYVTLRLLALARKESRELNAHLISVYDMTYAEISQVAGDTEKENHTIDVSENIYQNIIKLSKKIVSDIAQDIARRVDSVQLSDKIFERVTKISQNDMNRLMYTEDTTAFNDAVKDILIRYYERYYIVTAHDSRVCDVCRDLEGQAFDFKDAQIGINFPPLHPWCRCRIFPFTEIELEEIEE